MKVLVIGADGFVGRNTVKELRKDASLEVITASRKHTEDLVIDLSDRLSIEAAIMSVEPDVIVNCAGVVANDENAFKNGEFCRNLFEAIIARGVLYPKVIITGSAAEYGVVESPGPVDEDTPLNATSDYGKSKIEEVAIAQKYAEEYNIDLVVARIFNPIGPGMGDKFLLTSLLKQIDGYRDGDTSNISVSRLDSKRDYIDVRDLASAIHHFVTGSNIDHHVVQNIGSGVSTSNGEILENILRLVELDEKPTIIETRTEPEPLYAACADISRIKSEYNWEPKYDLVSTIEEIIHESGQ